MFIYNESARGDGAQNLRLDRPDSREGGAPPNDGRGVERSFMTGFDYGLSLDGLGALGFGGISPAAKTSGSAFGEIFSSISTEEASLEDLWKNSFERHYGQSAGRTYYHVMDASSISRGTWCHNDFPYGAFLTDEVDPSILTWQPTRMNPSQLDADVQRKISATLGQNAIVVPPELDEKMKTDPALRLKVLANIDRIYTFHGPRNYPPLPGTKFYGTRIYGSVIILGKDGEVANCEVSSGGGMIGPDERTLREIEREQKKKAARKMMNHMLEMKAIEKRIDARYMMMKDSMNSMAALSFIGNTPPVTGMPASFLLDMLGVGIW